MIARFFAFLSDSRSFSVDSLEIFFKDGRGLRLLETDPVRPRGLVETILSPQPRSIHGPIVRMVGSSSTLPSYHVGTIRLWRLMHILWRVLHSTGVLRRVD